MYNLLNIERSRNTITFSINLHCQFISDHDIGNKNESRGDNRLCRQGLNVPKEPWLYNCAEPILGRYVSIRRMGRGKLTLCEVEIYVNGTLSLPP